VKIRVVQAVLLTGVNEILSYLIYFSSSF